MMKLYKIIESHDKDWLVLGWIQEVIGPPMLSLVMNHKTT